MKKLITIAIIWLVSVNVTGQNFFSMQLVSNGGDQTDNATYKTCWSIGETVTATASAGSYILTQGFHQRIYPVLVVGSITANQTICYNQVPAQLTGTAPTGGLAPYTYQWQNSPNGTVWTDISGATGINYQPPALTATTYYRQKQISSGGNGTVITNTLTITVNPLPVPTITGPATVCAQSAGNVYTTQTGMTNYIWVVSAGGTITAGGTTTSSTVTVTWNTAGARTVSVNYSNANGCTAASPTVYNVTVNPLPVPTITGPAAMCTGTTGNVYTTQAGMTNYVWSVSAGGTITAGGTSTSTTVTVTWNSPGAQTVSVIYTNANGCTANPAGVFNVTVNPIPVPSINIWNNFPCPNSTGNQFYSEAGMTNYVWSISAGGQITAGQGTNTVTVTWLTPGLQTLSLVYTTPAGCTANPPGIYTTMVDPLPAAAGTITGSTSVCAGTNNVVYSTTTIANATSYSWTVPPGATIVSGAGTVSITVSYSASATSGNVTVEGVNQCGSGTPSSLAVTVNPLPGAAGTITGPAAICAPATGISYTVPAIANATGYSWTVPSGATIVSGGNTNHITVNFSASATSGVITVYGTNACGNGQVSPNFNVTVNPTPPTPVITQSGLILTSSAATGNQWYRNGNPIPGATSQTYEVTQSGDYTVVVTVNGCSSAPSNVITIVLPGVEQPNGGTLSVYPVPNDGRFTVTCTWIADETLNLEVYNSLGVMIHASAVNIVQGKAERVVDLRPVPDGVYTVVLKTEDNRVIRKILVRK
jgi:hypothetical protein